MKINTFIILFFTFVLALFISSCSIFNSDIEIEKRVSLYFEVEEIDQDLDMEQDTLRINEFKFSISQFNLEGDDIELGSSDNVRAFIFGYNESTENQRLIISVGLTIADNASFNKYKMFFEPVAENANILDNEFFATNGENYSLIIKGTFNQKNFTLRSKANFEKELTFDNVNLNDTNETIVLIKTINLRDVFFEENGTLIDPTNFENNAKILTNIESALEIEAYASDIY